MKSVGNANTWSGDHVDGRGYVIRALPSRNHTTCVEAAQPPTPEPPAPEPATGCVVEVVGSEVSLSWDREDGATSYAVRYFTNSPDSTKWLRSVGNANTWSGDHVDGRGYVIRALPSRNHTTCVEAAQPPTPETPAEPEIAIEDVIVSSEGASLQLSWRPLYFVDSYSVLLDGQVIESGIDDFVANVPDVAGEYLIESRFEGVTYQSEPLTYGGAVPGECIAVGLNDGTTAITWQNAPQDAYITLLDNANGCLLYTSPSPRDATLSRMPSSA